VQTDTRASSFPTKRWKVLNGEPGLVAFSLTLTATFPDVMLKLFNRPIPLASAHKKASGAVRFLRLSRNCRTFLFNCLIFLFIVQLFYGFTIAIGVRVLW
jgi:hypothetical protein